MPTLRPTDPDRAEREPADLPPSRPLLRPVLRWARWALVFLLAFTFLRGAVWAVTFPAWFGPDEDYHFLYVENLTMRGEIPNNKTKLFSREYTLATNSMHYTEYGNRRRTTFDQDDPKRSVRELENVSDADRTGVEIGRGVGVVHPPLYHAAGWVVNASLGDASAFTRFTALRWMTSLFGVLAVYAAWLLAAQVFRQEALRLLVAFLVAVQPIIGILSGIVNHDMLLIAFETAAVAMLLFLLRSPPRARQGLWVGVPIALALLVKTTALVLIPIAGLAYAGQWLVNRQRGREVLRSLGLAAAVVLVGAGWWYIGGVVVNETITGKVNSPPTADTSTPFTPGEVWTLVKAWTGYTYRTYWFHNFWYEAPRNSPYFYIPAYIGAMGFLGLGMLAFRRWRELLSPERPLVRQLVLLVVLVFALYLPVLAVDIKHYYDGQGFSMVAGRYLMPAYAGVVVLLIAALRELFDRRAQPVVFSALAVLAAAFGWKVWTANYLYRYYGTEADSWSTLFRRMSFDRPEFVNATTLTIAMALLFASLLAALACVVAGHLPPGAGARVAAKLPRRRRRGPAEAA
jgi:hypothetical protein